jgi:large subunit ribosomal protein L3
MIKSIWVKKIGMSQVFLPDGKMFPVTAVSIEKSFVLQLKTVSHDGYNAVQVGIPRQKYKNQAFSSDWLKKKKTHFLVIKELLCDDPSLYKVGELVSCDQAFFDSFGSAISVSAKSRGKGFQGAVKRYGFSGGRGSHGDKLGRGPGSLSGLRTQGRVFKGKKMPGRMGGKMKTISGLKIVDHRIDDNILLISGPIPGFSGSFIKITKKAT